jgi:hypothetical protein
MDRRKQDSAATTVMSATTMSSRSWAEGEVAGGVAWGEVVHSAVVDAAHEVHGGTRRKGDLVVAQAQHTSEDWKLRHCRTWCSPAPRPATSPARCSQCWLAVIVEWRSSPAKGGRC